MKMSDISERHGKYLAHAMRQHGTEVMPDEAREDLISLLGRIREQMQEAGHDVPESDVELAKMASALLDKPKQAISKHHGELAKLGRTCRAVLVFWILFGIVLIICFWRMF